MTLPSISLTTDGLFSESLAQNAPMRAGKPCSHVEL
jgi:hypothetical protein